MAYELMLFYLMAIYFVDYSCALQIAYWDSKLLVNFMETLNLFETRLGPESYLINIGLSWSVIWLIIWSGTLCATGPSEPLRNADLYTSLHVPEVPYLNVKMNFLLGLPQF